MDFGNEIKNISSTSVIDLKAELLKKQSQVTSSSSTSQSPQIISSRLKLGGSKVQKPIYKMNSGVSDRSARDLEAQAKELHPNLEASWVALQRKSLIYDQMEKQGGLTEEHEDSLIDFLRKEEVVQNKKSKQKESLDPWVEIKDDFGRTRLVRKSQLESTFQSKSVEFVKESVSTLGKREKSGEPSMSTIDVHKEQRHAWEQEQQQSQGNLAMHYDATREIRNLGTVNYTFSKDEDSRKKELQDLQDARMETIKSRELQEKKKFARKVELQERRDKILQKAAKRSKVSQDSSLPLLQADSESKVKEIKEMTLDEFFATF